MDKEIKKARDFAIERHGEQKYGDHPYVYHLDIVYHIVVAAGLDKDYQIAAYLHDLIEDTNTTQEEIAFIFNPRVANMVNSVTGEGANRKERKASTLKKLKEFPEGISLKMADRFANMKESLTNEKLFEMYKKELPEYMHLFINGDKKILEQIENLKPRKKLRLN